jgi:hypothetical protein
MIRSLWYFIVLTIGSVLFRGAMKCAQVVTMAIGTPVTWTWSQAMLTGTTFNPLTDWQYETPSFQGMIEVFSRATAVGLIETISSAGDTLKQESPVQAGGTAGVTPSRLNTEPVVGRAAAGEKIRVGYRNPTGGTITVDGQIVLTPLGGGGARRGGFKRGKRGRR